MRDVIHTVLRISLLGLICLALGCGTPAVKDGSQPVKGKLLNNGTPLTVQYKASGAGWVELRFYPVDAAGNIGELHYQAGVMDDGSFNVPGPSNNGLPPGKYRIVVRQWDPYPEIDKLGGKYDETHSPLTRDFSGASALELDLAKLGP